MLVLQGRTLCGADIDLVRALLAEAPACRRPSDYPSTANPTESRHPYRPTLNPSTGPCTTPVSRLIF
ncbi:MAG: hypothetical protein EXS25_04620 [Pedosphaera sp.]|nr:hypothetical protein [Pedosphaera sp.]